MRPSRMGANRGFVVAAAWMLAAGCVNVFARMLPSAVDLFLSLGVGFVYVGLALAWGVSMTHRLLPGRMRRRAIAAAGLMALWMLLRAYKYRVVAAGDVLLLMCWYGYYVCHLGIACLLFLTCLDLWERERGHVRGVRGCVIVAAVTSSCALLANSAHQGAFSFEGGVPLVDARYEYGPLYYAVIALAYGQVAASILILLRLHHLPVLTARNLGPLAVLAASGVFALLIARVLDPIGLRSPYNYPELACFTLLLIWEWLVRARLIPSNARYQELFAVMPDPLCITDGRLRRVYETGTRLQATNEQMGQALSGPHALDRDTLLHGGPLAVGYAFWETDVSLLNRINDELEQGLEELAGQNELLAAQNEVKMQRAQIEARDELMTRVIRSFDPQLRALKEWVVRLRENGISNSELARLYVKGTYVKRAMNLRLLEAERRGLGSDELVLSLRDSVRALALLSVEGAVTSVGSGGLAPGVAEELYGAFEQVVEGAEGSLKRILVHVDGREPSLSITLEPASLASRLRAAGIACNEADGALYVRCESAVRKAAEGGAE